MAKLVALEPFSEIVILRARTLHTGFSDLSGEARKIEIEILRVAGFLRSKPWLPKGIFMFCSSLWVGPEAGQQIL